ncbi:ABC transporter ATP-binding protein [Fertoebacter nigrum]|uniref:ABC transporter ATP-binding protein n=1 Tax=Fertoeibacter niger TaxID=2656921 RepID=A0A8X8H0S4_9RHOB|nr:ABC transporter ATP-binding protein [Fertoeibacter niger]
MGEDCELEVRNLSCQFGSFKAVDDVSLRVRRGSIHALIGPNGAGKTTCFNLITRYLTPTSGNIIFRGEDITSKSPSQIADRGLVRSFQICSVFQSMTVLENVCLALQRKTGDQYAFWRSKKSLKNLHETAVSYIEPVGLLPWLHKPASDLSYGRKRALEFSVTMALEPKMMLLDEPFAGMGHEDIGGVAALIQAEAKDRTILIVEHNLSVVQSLCDRVTVLVRGKVAAEGDYKSVSQNDQVVRAYLGVDP